MQRVALVTGGAIRVGRAISEALYEAGFTLALHYHGSAEAAVRFQDEHPGSTLHRADLAEVSEVNRLADEVAGAHGRIDVLVNSAALFYPTPVGEATQEQWDRLHHVNLRAPFFLAQAVRPHMPAGGVIINIADVNAVVPWARYLAYGTTKAGIVSLTHGLARELAPDIRVNAVAPGPVLLPESYAADKRSESVERTLLKREGTPAHVAHAVRFLVENDYITGAVLPVDGGRALT